MSKQTIFIISGEQGAGKTTRLKEVLSLLQRKEVSVAGFIAEGSWENNKRTAFTLVNIQSGESMPLCRNKLNDSWIQLGRFFFDPNAISMAEKWLQEGVSTHADLIAIDEIGLFELNGKVWHSALNKLLKQDKQAVIITVRNRFLERVIKKYNLQKVEIFSVDTAAFIIAEKLLK